MYLKQLGFSGISILAGANVTTSAEMFDFGQSVLEFHFTAQTEPGIIVPCDEDLQPPYTQNKVQSIINLL